MTGSQHLTAHGSPAFELDLSNCDREPVHLANAIQPHGALLVLEEPSLRIVQASANTGEFLGTPWQTLTGQPLDTLLGPDHARALRTQLADARLTGVLAHLLRLPHLPGRAEAFHVFGNRIDGRLLLEFERAGVAESCAASPSLCALSTAIQALKQTESLAGLLAMAVRQVRDFSGFERVMAYRFDVDGSGQVIAESLAPELKLESYLGLHYPASDIPAPARRLFKLSPLRHLPDADYVPVPLLPALDGVPIDLSHASLRSVSLMYTGYLKNMGVKATMVMPINKNGALWGLISCMQHSAPAHVPYEGRIPLEFLGQILSQLLGSREDLDHQAYQDQLDDARRQLSSQMGHAETLREALLDQPVNLLTGLDAAGVVLLAGGELTRLGGTPDDGQLWPLLRWLAGREAPVYSTDRLPHDYPPAWRWRAVASGLLSIRLSRQSPEWVIWFRPEVPRDVAWAGNPHKAVEIAAIGTEVRLQPRTSFALWQDVVRGQSRPWLDCELDHAHRLSRDIADTLVERAWLLARINRDLERINQDLDAFAFAASHDMKEPLRGIHNTAEFLLREEAGRLSDQGQQRLGTILRLTGRLASLLDSLLAFSRVGRGAPEPQDCPVAELVQQALDVVRHAMPGEPLHCTVLPGLPVVRGVRAWVVTIFQNLITNALKYNDKPRKEITIGSAPGTGPPVFFVRDNGIGIAAADQPVIFELFRRLHGRDDFGGGAGAGLTIVRKAVERLGGHIWVESVPDEGSTFRFTLAPSRNT